MFSSCRAARLFIADETTTTIIEIHSAVERSNLWKVRNPHHLNQFDIYENLNLPVTATVSTFHQRSPPTRERPPPSGFVLVGYPEAEVVVPSILVTASVIV